MAMKGNKTQEGIFVSWDLWKNVLQTLDYFPATGYGVYFVLTARSNVSGSGGDILNAKIYTIRTNASGAVEELALKKQSFKVVASGVDHDDVGFYLSTPAAEEYANYMFIGLRFVITLRNGSIVTIDENPLGYIDSAKSNTPTITEFTARRCDASGNLSDEGQYIRNTIKGSIAPGMGWTTADHTLRVGYRVQGSSDPYAWVNKAGFAASIDIDEKLDTGAVFAAGSVYEIRCELTNNERSITVHAAAVLPKAFANLHLSGSGYGVGVGQYSTATEEDPKFECAYPAHFYGGIRQLDYSTERMDTGAKWIDGKTIYRKCFTFGSIAANSYIDLQIGEKVGDIITLRGGAYVGSDIYYAIPDAHYNSFNGQIQILARELSTTLPTIRVRTGASRKPNRGFVIIKYTLP